MLQLSVAKFQAGAYVCIEGTNNGDKFFIIQTGQVRSFVETSCGIMPKTLGPGDFVAVVSCMSGHTHVDSAVAVTDVSCIVVRRDQYQELIRLNRPVAIKIIRTFASNVRALNEILGKKTSNKEANESSEQIFNSAVYYDKHQMKDVAHYGYHQYLREAPNGANLALARKRYEIVSHVSHAVYLDPSAELARSYPARTMVFSECQSGADMFIIKGGQIQISKIIDGKEVILAMLKAGDMFGEMALLENKPRSASAIATEETSLMAVNRKNFDQMVETQPQLVASLTTTLSERIWSMYRQIMNTTLPDVPRMIDYLSLQIEKNKAVAYTHEAFQTDYSIEELAKVCGANYMNRKVIDDFKAFSHVMVKNYKIFIPDCSEFITRAEYFREQARKKQGKSQN